MIKRTLLTGLLYLAMIFTFLYLVVCFVQWEIIQIPPINEWDNDARMTLFLTYFCLCVVAFMVELEIRDKKKRQTKELASKLKSEWL